MKKRIAVVLVAVLALAACGSSKSSGSGGGPTSPGSKTSNGGGSDNGFASLVQKAKDAKYKVTYSSSSGSDSFTIAQDPPKFSFVQADSATYVTADGTSVSCSGKGADATCTELPGGTGNAMQQGWAAAFGGVGQLFVTLANENLGALGNLVHISTTSKTIAGRDGECATIDKNSFSFLAASIGNASYQVCVDKDTGVMLSTKTTDEKGKVDEVTATDFGSPSDSDFTPPATPSTIPGGIPTVPTT